MTIGSIGTIAQTYKSDCDYWVNIREPEIAPEGRFLLEKKCRAIEEWASHFDCEIYFFLMDIDKTRDNNFDSKAEEESAGSALHLLLKDELFRSHIQVAGKMLLWWLIPPGLSQEEYRHYKKRLAASKCIDLDNFIDLGYIPAIPRSEIFGASLWQMNKALVSPFKSIIKFAYLELLLNTPPGETALLSDKIKLQITFPEALVDSDMPSLRVTDVDPYLLLARELTTFYQWRSGKKYDEFMRICFFLKTMEGLDCQRQNPVSTRHLQRITTIMNDWGILPDDVEFYRDYKEWRVGQLITMGKKVHEYLSETYSRLRLIFKDMDKGEVLTITEHDISVLGRKLFTLHDKKSGKVQFVKGVTTDSLMVEDITIHLSRYQGKDFFFAFQGEYDDIRIQENKEYIIKRETNLIHLLVWLVINRILTKESNVFLTKTYLPINLNDIKEILREIFNSFTIEHFSEIPAEDLLQPEIIVSALAVINFSKAPVKGSKNLETSIISKNSYGEYFIAEYHSLKQYKNALTLLLTKHFVSRWNNNLRVFIPEQPEKHLISNMLSG